ncbi:hypothetical protein Tco_0786372 [Tanacetum coccineum]
MNDDTPMCERHEVHYIQLKGYQNQDSHHSYSHQSHHDPNDSEKSLTDLNNDVKHDLEHFKSCTRSMRTVHDTLFDKDDQSKTDLEKSITKFLDGERVTNMFMVRVVEENERIHEDMELKRRSKLKVKDLPKPVPISFGPVDSTHNSVGTRFQVALEKEFNYLQL